MEQLKRNGSENMSLFKRIITILAIIITSMLIVPLIVISTVKAEAGMMTTMLFFFAVYPVISVCLGIIAGKDIKHLWFVPALIAVLFWFFSLFTYQTAFPVVYSVIYFVISVISMVIKSKNNKK